MQVLLLSAYDASSHRRWREGMVNAFPEFQWTVLKLPPRYFNWRLRGNSLSWAFGEREVLEKHYDLIVATSMTDLSALKGMVPALAKIPTMVYFHENQFDYPQSEQQSSSVEPQILNIYTALSADCVVFNSQYNRRTFLDGATQLLNKLPDHVPEGIIEQLNYRSEVIPVPLELECFQPLDIRREGKGLDIVWNHRWEYDKGPERLFLAIKHLLSYKLDISLHIIGEQFRQLPPVFDEIHRFLEEGHPGVLKHWGYVESRDEYLGILAAADVVLSTALHDFQGLAVLEAVAQGCVPVVPDRLAYQELFPSEYSYSSYPDSPDKEARALADKLAGLVEQNLLPEPPDVSTLAWVQLKADYVRIFDKTVRFHS